MQPPTSIPKPRYLASASTTPAAKKEERSATSDTHNALHIRKAEFSPAALADWLPSVYQCELPFGQCRAESKMIADPFRFCVAGLFFRARACLDVTRHRSPPRQRGKQGRSRSFQPLPSRTLPWWPALCHRSALNARSSSPAGRRNLFYFKHAVATRHAAPYIGGAL